MGAWALGCSLHCLSVNTPMIRIEERPELTYQVAECDKVHGHLRANLLKLERSEDDFVRRPSHHLNLNFRAVAEGEVHKFGNVLERGSPRSIEVEGIGEHHDRVRGNGTFKNDLSQEFNFLASFLCTVKLSNWLSSTNNVEFTY